MRKWTYLVAALLMGGVSTSLTSCIDNDEPAGITDLRGAKAEFIRAKAAYETALAGIQQVKIEREQVYLEMDKNNLEIEKLKLAKEQAQNEYEIAEIQNNLEALAEEQKARLLGLQEQTAIAQESLEKALVDLELTLATYRNDEYTAAINNALFVLQQARVSVGQQEDAITSLEGQLIDAKAQLGDSYRAGLVRDSLKIEKALEIENTLLETAKTLTSISKTDLVAQQAEINNRIGEIDKKVLELTQQIADIDKAIKPIEAEIVKIENKWFEPTQVVTIKKDDVAKDIQKDFVNILDNTSPDGSSSSWSDLASASFYDENKDEMTGDYTSDKTGLKKVFGSSSDVDQLDNSLLTLANNVKSHYLTEFDRAYYTAFGSNVTEVTPEHIQMAKTKLAELKEDKEAAATIYTNDSTAWETARKAYEAAAKAYGFSYTPYASTSEAITNYKSAAVDKQTAAARTEIKAKLSDYYKVRMPLDNPTIATVTIGTATVKLSEALSNTAFTDAMLKDILDNKTVQEILGSDINLNDKQTSYSLASDPKEDGAIQAYIRAAKKIWDNSIDCIAEARVTPATEEEYQDLIASGSISNNIKKGSWFKYMDVYNGYKIFNNIESWIALYDKLTATQEEFAEATKAIQVESDKKEIEIADQKNQKYLIEIDRKALDNTQTTSLDNPYNSSISVGEKQALITLRRGIESSISTGSTSYNFYYYDVVLSNGKFVSATWQLIQNKDAESIVSSLEDEIIDIMKGLDIAKANIEKFDKGYTYGSAGNIQVIETQLENAKKKLEEENAKLERAQIQVNKLLEAFANSGSNTEETPAE